MDGHSVLGGPAWHRQQSHGAHIGAGHRGHPLVPAQQPVCHPLPPTPCPGCSGQIHHTDMVLLLAQFRKQPQTRPRGTSPHCAASAARPRRGPGSAACSSSRHPRPGGAVPMARRRTIKSPTQVLLPGRVRRRFGSAAHGARRTSGRTSGSRGTELALAVLTALLLAAAGLPLKALLQPPPAEAVLPAPPPLPAGCPCCPSVARHWAYRRRRSRLVSEALRRPLLLRQRARVAQACLRRARRRRTTRRRIGRKPAPLRLCRSSSSKRCPAAARTPTAQPRRHSAA
mmetsp:Transcript_115529/g.288692  ORF Transcript_115529/g.288692 Transcript_115529/m.288692 type:complete len:285 (-) Transcript_115529:195-1049(-)